MGEYEPNDSRNVTLKQDRAPGEPPRTGPRESETRHQQGGTGLEQDRSSADAEAPVDRMGAADAEAEAELRERAMERDTPESGSAPHAASPGRND